MTDNDSEKDYGYTAFERVEQNLMQAELLDIRLRRPDERENDGYILSYFSIDMTYNLSGRLVIHGMIGGERVRFVIEGRNFEEGRNLLVQRKVRRIVEWHKGFDEPASTEPKVEKIGVEWGEQRADNR